MTRRTKLRLGFAAWMTLVLSIMFGHCSYKALAQPGSFFLWGDIKADTAMYVLDYIRETKDPIIYIDSPGGHIDASLLIAGAVRAKGNVRCIVKGKAASGAFAVLQACAVRQIKAGAILVTHEPRVLPGFSMDRVMAADVLKQLIEKSWMWNAVCRHRLRITAADYERKVKGLDWIMDSSEALRVGAVDQVIQ